MFLSIWTDLALMISLIVGVFGLAFGFFQHFDSKKANRELEAIKAKYSERNYRKQIYHEYEFKKLQELIDSYMKVNNYEYNLISFLEHPQINYFNIENVELYYDRLNIGMTKFIEDLHNTKAFLPSNIYDYFHESYEWLSSADSKLFRIIKNEKETSSYDEITENVKIADEFFYNGMNEYRKYIK